MQKRVIVKQFECFFDLVFIGKLDVAESLEGVIFIAFEPDFLGYERLDFFGNVVFSDVVGEVVDENSSLIVGTGGGRLGDSSE